MFWVCGLELESEAEWIVAKVPENGDIGQMAPSSGKICFGNIFSKTSEEYIIFQQEEEPGLIPSKNQAQ